MYPAAAKNVSCSNYSEETLAAIRKEIDSAQKVYANSSSTEANYQASADKLNALLAKKDSASSLVKNPIYVNQFDTSITTGDCTIFTSDFNGGKITASSANHIWTQHVLLTWDSKQNAYVVTSNTPGTGASTKDITLTSNQILIAAHNGGGASTTNHQLLAKAEIGQTLKLCGIDIESKEIGLLSYIRFEGEGTSSGNSGDSTDKPGDTTETPEDTTETPGDTTETPGDTTETPGDTTETPEDTSETPDDTTVNSEESSDDSEGANQEQSEKVTVSGVIIIPIIIIAAVAVAAVVVVLVLRNKKKAQ